MARTAQGTQLTFQHRTLQLALRAQLLQGFLRLWPIWTGDEASFARLVAATIPLIQLGHLRSAGLASAYYRAFRQAESAEGDAAPALAERPDDEQLVTSLYVTGQAQTRASMAAGMSATKAREAALVRVSGAVTRHALNGGRNTVINSALQDPQATGWQRVTGGKPCAFCLMLASRGPVYRSRESASFSAHDHCSCYPEASYETGAKAWTDQALEHRATWQRAQREAQEAGEETGLNALRRTLPDLNPDGTRRLHRSAAEIAESTN